MPKLVDSHAHMQFTDYDEDRAQVIQRALDGGIWIVNSGSNLENSKSVIKLADEYEDGVYATVGIHPSEVGEGFNKEKIRLMALHPKCVAIGECGLEYTSRVRLAEIGFSEIDNKEAQAELFTHHINLSHETKKPLVIATGKALLPFIPETATKILVIFPIKAGYIYPKKNKALFPRAE